MASELELASGLALPEEFRIPAAYPAEEASVQVREAAAGVRLRFRRRRFFLGIRIAELFDIIRIDIRQLDRIIFAERVPEI